MELDVLIPELSRALFEQGKPSVLATDLISELALLSVEGLELLT